MWEKNAKDESDFVGYCYLDLFPRRAYNGFILCTHLRLNSIPAIASKYSHAAVWPLLAGYDIPGSDGKRSYPLAAMVANLAKPTPDKPALMRHDDVVRALFLLTIYFRAIRTNLDQGHFLP